MYIVNLEQKNPSNRLLGLVKGRAKLHKEIVQDLNVERGEPQLAEIDMKQSGSGYKGIKNKLKQLDLHSDAKKKYNKFISLNL